MCTPKRRARHNEPAFKTQGDDGLTESKGQAACGAIKYTLVCFFASGMILGLCYFFVSQSPFVRACHLS